MQKQLQQQLQQQQQQQQQNVFRGLAPGRRFLSRFTEEGGFSDKDCLQALPKTALNQALPGLVD
jgi:hypothetical protein